VIAPVFDSGSTTSALLADGMSARWGQRVSSSARDEKKCASPLRIT
jgi:hypothetical protein